MLSKTFVKIILVCLFLPLFVLGEEEGRVNLYLFYSETCFHCEEELILLEELKKEYSYLDVYTYEIHDEGNYSLFLEVKEKYNILSSGVPVTIIGDTYYQGYDDYKSKEILMKTISYYSIYGYVDWLGEKVDSSFLSYIKKERTETLKEFLDNYGNVKLLGFIDSSFLDVQYLALVLGVLASSNLVVLIGYLLVVLICRKDDDRRLLFIYPFLLLGLSLMGLKICLLLFLLVMFLFWKFKDKRRKILRIACLVMISGLGYFLQEVFSYDYLSILNFEMKFLNIGIVSEVSYYLIYMVVMILFSLGWIFVFDKIKKKLRIE